MDKAAVLLLERSASVIDVAREALAGDADLHVTNSVELALRVVPRLLPAVVVLDATMVGGSPGELVAKIRAMHPAVRIVFVSEAGDLFDRRHAQLGTLLPKPFTAERFAEVIRSALRFQSMSAGVQRMRHSSGTYRAVALSEPVAQATRRASSRPPPARPPSAPPSAARTISEPPARPRTRNLTPPPPPREELQARPRTQPPPPPREELQARPRTQPPPPPRGEMPTRQRNLTPPPVLREEAAPRARNLTPPPIPREDPPARPRNLTPPPIPREEPAAPGRPRTQGSTPPPALRTEPTSDAPPPLVRPR
ncbi:MAG: hypothetical protein U0441_21305 [Polyangiaceae bacterium]